MGQANLVLKTVFGAFRIGSIRCAGIHMRYDSIDMLLTSVKLETLFFHLGDQVFDANDFCFWVRRLVFGCLLKSNKVSAVERYGVPRNI